MSGSGRKTHYRKSVTEEFLNGLPLPGEGEVLCKTHSSRGTNIFEVSVRMQGGRDGGGGSCYLLVSLFVSLFVSWL